jgi:4-hydroxybenzoate polyprenyltransferase
MTALFFKRFMASSPSFLQRWWIYQRERFPLIKHGVLVAIYSGSAVSYSWLLRDRTTGTVTTYPTGGSWAIAFIVLFLLFLQLRIADEFKDFEDDRRYRPYRPVPRGLVSLRELGLLGIGCGCLQLGLTVALGGAMIWLLLLNWGYLGLMSAEFFCSRWLKAHSWVYLVSHLVILPLMTLYATGCDWAAAQTAIPPDLKWFFALSFTLGMMIELSRKIRAPGDEEPGVDTYSAHWGIKRAIATWLMAAWLTAIFSLLAAQPLQMLVVIAFLILWLLTATLIAAWQFLVHPAAQQARWLERVTALWVLGLYGGLGGLPLVLQYFPPVFQG